MRQIILSMCCLFAFCLYSYGQQKQIAKAKNTQAENTKKANAVKLQKLSLLDVKIPDHSWVQTCIRQYANVYGVTTDTRIKNAHTTEIAFQRDLLKAWLEELELTTDCDNIRVQFGIYTGNPDNRYTIPHINRIKANRLMIFLYPYSGNNKARITALPLSAKGKMVGEEADPYDLGEIHP